MLQEAKSGETKVSGNIKGTSEGHELKSLLIKGIAKLRLSFIFSDLPPLNSKLAGYSENCCQNLQPQGLLPSRWG
jgi:hypothetical protein